MKCYTDALYRRRWWILLSIAFGTLVSVINASMVSVALPTISRTMKLDLQVLQWIILIYLLTISSSLLVAGRLADLFGRKVIYAGGFLVLIAGSLVCAFAPNFHILLFGRVIQALGAAMPMANGMPLTTCVFPSQERGRALGIVGSVVAVGSLLGPVIGGFLVDSLGWHWVFLINIPGGLFAFATAMILLPRVAPAGNGEKFDYPGSLLFAGAIVMLLLVLTEIGEGRLNWWLLLLGIFTFIVFIMWDRKQAFPILDFELFKIPLVTTSLTAAFLSFLAISTVMILMPFYLEEILGYAPYQVGLLMSPYPLVLAVTAPLSGWLSDRWGPLGLTTGGLCLSMVAFLLIGFLGSGALYHGVALRLALAGLGMGLFQSPNNSTVMGSVPVNKLGLAGGVNALVRNLGMIIGTAVVVLIFSSVKNACLQGAVNPSHEQVVEAFLRGWRAVYLFAAGIAALAAAVSLSRVRFLVKREPAPEAGGVKGGGKNSWKK